MTTCASFKGMFFAFNQRLPTDQEIFDAGVREGIKRADGTILEYARPNAGILNGYHGEIVPEMEQNVMVKLADTFPL